MQLARQPAQQRTVEPIRHRLQGLCRAQVSFIVYFIICVGRALGSIANMANNPNRLTGGTLNGSGGWNGGMFSSAQSVSGGLFYLLFCDHYLTCTGMGWLEVLTD